MGLASRRLGIRQLQPILVAGYDIVVNVKEVARHRGIIAYPADG
jgi:hypothetical protein